MVVHHMLICMTELQQNNKMSDVIKIPHQTSYVNVLSEN